MSIMVGTGRGAIAGVLIKNAEAIEIAARIPENVGYQAEAGDQRQ